VSWTARFQEEMAKVAERASQDAEFRRLAVSDPRAALKEVTGLELPSEFKLQVVDGAGYHATIVLPEMRGASDELSDEDLETVAGGISIRLEDFKSPRPVWFPPRPKSDIERLLEEAMAKFYS